MTRLRRAPRPASGVTLVEALVALAVLALAGAALASVQLGALRTSRTVQLRQQAAALLEGELLLLRLGAGPAAGECAAEPLPSGWECEVELTCTYLLAPCDLLTFQVRVTPPEGSALTGRGARYAPLAGTAP